MALAVVIRREGDLFWAEARGEFSLAEGKRTFRELMAALWGEAGASKMLVNALEVTGSPSVMERFEYASFIAEEIRKWQERAGWKLPRLAYVVRIALMDPDGFGESVAVNRGVQVKVFAGVAEARAWLGA